MIDTNLLGNFLLHFSIVVAVFAAMASAVGRWRNDGRLLLTGERAGYAVTALLVCAIQAWAVTVALSMVLRRSAAWRRASAWGAM